MDDLPPTFFRRQDETPDEQFYRHPRFVTHIDDAAIAAVTSLYREFFPRDARVLDLMSSWISHLPPEAPYPEVVGVGLNHEELAANTRLSRFVVQNLNTTAHLPFADGSFDAAGIAVSIDYLTQPVAVLRDLRRVLSPGSPVVITFSNRCFPTKAVLVWQHLDDAGHVALVTQYLERAGYTDLRALDRSPGGGDPLYGVIGFVPAPSEG
ncbi:SAM-dependent methyltransferase [Deinococcus metalli]|uniref:Methyltransferase type 11 n=1 Tax=Deinococcus metalli TaxID=1141878 RepID=A0A7W8NQ65_9DEIO|nr:methyltransferase domain-containing protein [Deinococcus metalli]MBB5376490.1 SAM-dependent methyltransferase [Deinococcus metalli]GHF43647.1 methyltransferase type 11 [Deinococcus metalli]